MSLLSPQLRRQVEALILAGESDGAVCRATGVAQKTAKRYRRLLGLPPRQPAGRARYQGPPTVGDYDESVVDRVVFDRLNLSLTPRERHDAIIRLSRRDWSATEIAERLNCSTRTVHRARGREACR